MFFQEKLPRKIDDGIDYILKIVFILVLLIGVYVLYDKFYIYSLTGRENSLLYSTRAVPVEEMERNYTDAIAWLYIEDTLDEPLMQGLDNTVYLNKAPDGTYSLRGSLFVDSRNSSDFTDDYTLVYGHHMANYQMFGALDHYFEEDYWTEEHTSVLITLKDTTELNLTVFAMGSIDASVDEIFNPTEVSINGILNFIETTTDLEINRSDLQTLTGKRIVCLSTCQTPDSTLRTCVLCYVNE